MKTIYTTVFISILIVGLVIDASAEIVRFDFSGTITSVDDQDNVLIGTGITAGYSNFTGSIIYDSDATLISNASANEAIYPGTLYQVVIDGLYTTATSSPQIAIFNDYPNSSTEFVDAFVCDEPNQDDISTNLPEAIEEFYIELVSFFSSGGGPLPGTQLPLTLDLEGFREYRSISLNGAGSMRIEGEIEELNRFYPDDDSDGVPNHLDLCPETPEGLKVKINGCVEGDYDNDGDIDGGDLKEFSSKFGIPN